MVDKTLSSLKASFQDNDKLNPQLFTNGNMDIIKSFCQVDPKENAQKAITLDILNHLFICPKSDIFSQHITDLCNVVFLFACQSCEYTKTSSTQKQELLTSKTFLSAPATNVSPTQNTSIKHPQYPSHLFFRKTKTTLRLSPSTTMMKKSKTPSYYGLVSLTTSSPC